MKVVKVGAVWCSGCLVMRPRWQELEQENPWLKTEYYDYDQDREKAIHYQVQSQRLPEFIFLDKNNNEFLRLHGEIAKEKLIEIILENKDQ